MSIDERDSSFVFPVGKETVDNTPIPPIVDLYTLLIVDHNMSVEVCQLTYQPIVSTDGLLT